MSSGWVQEIEVRKEGVILIWVVRESFTDKMVFAQGPEGGKEVLHVYSWEMLAKFL